MAIRAFVGFFGVNRSARWTLRSIDQNVLQPMRDAGYELFVACHFNHPAVIENIPSSARGIRLHRDVSLLAPDIVWNEPQREANIANILPIALSVPYYHRVDQSGQSRRNLMQQLHSLRRLQRILSCLEQSFDLYALLRPDLDYIDRLETRELDALLTGAADMISPNWEKWTGVNDRFAFCNEKAAGVFLNRWQLVESYCASHGHIHSERLLAYAVQEAGLRLMNTDMRALRVRSAGWTAPEGFQLPLLMRVKHRVRRLCGMFGG